MAKDVKSEMDSLKKSKDLNLEDGERVINMYSKIEMESLGGEGNPIVKGKKFHVHPEHVKHLIEKKFAVKKGDETVEVPDLEKPKEPITIQV